MWFVHYYILCLFYFFFFASFHYFTFRMTPPFYALQEQEGEVGEMKEESREESECDGRVEGKGG